jgi:formyltetrahydrofolate deformylase
MRTNASRFIGASAHYLKADLDGGPIIEQGLERVSHSDTSDDLIKIDRNLECSGLERAVGWQREHRVMLAGRRTVLFPWYQKQPRPHDP